MELLLDRLFGNIGIGLIGLLMILVDQRSRIDKDQFERSTAIQLERLGIVASRHTPPTAYFPIIENSLRISTILVVTHDREPVDHQLRMAVNQLIIGHPKRILNAGNSFEVVNITGSYHKLNIGVLGQFAHALCNRFLIVVTVPSQVIGHNEVEVVIQQ